MTVVAIGTLGLSKKYEEVQYQFTQAETITTKFSLDALVQRENNRGKHIDKIIVLLTKQARTQGWDELRQTLIEHFGSTLIIDQPIEDGKNPDELRSILETITGAVDHQDKLYIDVTTGLRHVPMLLIMASAYLRAAKNVSVESVAYGAFELREMQQDTAPICQVFELLPFVELFDWAGATTAFKRTGDVSGMAELLRNPGVAIEGESRPAIDEMIGQLDRIALSLELNRPEEAMREIGQLRATLKVSTNQIEAFVKPFGLITNLIDSTFQTVELPNANITTPEARLAAQRNLIKWYADRKHFTLAALLAREWIVSSFMVAQNNGVQLDIHDVRQAVSNQLNGGLPGNSSLRMKKLHEVWNNHEIGRIRNIIAHATQSGSKTQIQSAEDLKKRVQDIIAAINVLGD